MKSKITRRCPYCGQDYDTWEGEGRARTLLEHLPECEAMGPLFEALKLAILKTMEEHLDSGWHEDG